MTAFDTTTCPLSGGNVGILPEEPAPGIKATEAAGPPPDRVRAIEVAAHQDGEAGARGPAGLLGNLQSNALQRDGVVGADHAGLFVTQDLLEIGAAAADEGRGRIGRRYRELAVVAREEGLGD